MIHDTTTITSRQRCKIASALVGIRSRAHQLARVCNQVIEAVHLNHPDAAERLQEIVEDCKRQWELAEQIMESVR